MARKSRISRELQALIDAAKEDDRAYAARWLAERLIKFAPHFGWYRSSGGDRVRALADGGLVMVLNSPEDCPEGWYIADDKGRTFAPDDPLPSGARRHDNLVFFDSEEIAEQAAHNLPGQWSDVR